MGNGLYANIADKKKRIAAGSGEKMNKVGSKKAPSAQDFKDAAKTAKKPYKANSTKEVSVYSSNSSQTYWQNSISDYGLD